MINSIPPGDMVPYVLDFLLYGVLPGIILIVVGSRFLKKYKLYQIKKKDVDDVMNKYDLKISGLGLIFAGALWIIAYLFVIVVFSY